MKTILNLLWIIKLKLGSVNVNLSDANEKAQKYEIF